MTGIPTATLVGAAVYGLWGMTVFFGFALVGLLVWWIVQQRRR